MDVGLVDVGLVDVGLVDVGFVDVGHICNLLFRAAAVFYAGVFLGLATHHLNVSQVDADTLRHSAAWVAPLVSVTSYDYTRVTLYDVDG